MREPQFIAQFLRDIATHKLYVQRDDGLYRHLRFRATDPDGRTSGCMGFDLVTWPGWLAYSGDMGCFVFQREADMLCFFRKSARDGRTIFDGIDRRYWAEKCEAEGARGDGIREFSWAQFVSDVKQHVGYSFPEDGDEGERTLRAELLAHIEDNWPEREDEFGAVQFLDDYRYAYIEPGPQRPDGYESDGYVPEHTPGRRTWCISDWESSSEVYTQRFNWCCCALAWGVAQYDAMRAAAPTAPPSPTAAPAATTA